jgi:hypothetical protein
VGDVSGDGRPDLLVGSRYYSSSVSLTGRVSMFEGGSGWSGYYSPSYADGVVEGDAYAGYLGATVDASSDFDSDGINDILIGRVGVNLTGSSGGDALLFTGGVW